MLLEFSKFLGHRLFDKLFLSARTLQSLILTREDSNSRFSTVQIPKPCWRQQSCHYTLCYEMTDMTRHDMEYFSIVLEVSTAYCVLHSAFTVGLASTSAIPTLSEKG